MYLRYPYLISLAPPIIMLIVRSIRHHAGSLGVSATLNLVVVLHHKRLIKHDIAIYLFNDVVFDED